MLRRVLGGAAWPAPDAPRNPLERVSTRSFAGVDTAAADARWAQLFETGGGAATTRDELTQTIEYVGGLAAHIEARGGHVIFVELPSNGRTRAVEERRYPRDRYWDVFAATIGHPAFTVRDVPALASFLCPDGSHLDARDAAAFSRALAKELEARNLAP
jgi:hypothetical protein